MPTKSRFPQLSCNPGPQPSYALGKCIKNISAARELGFSDGTGSCEKHSGAGSGMCWTDSLARVGILGCSAPILASFFLSQSLLSFQQKHVPLGLSFSNLLALLPLISSCFLPCQRNQLKEINPATVNTSCLLGWEGGNHYFPFALLDPLAAFLHPALCPNRLPCFECINRLPSDFLVGSAHRRQKPEWRGC